MRIHFLALLIISSLLGRAAAEDKNIDKFIEPAAAPVAPVMAPAERAKAELAFLQNAMRGATLEMYPTLLEQVDLHLQFYRDLEGADQAQFLKCEIHEKQDDMAAAVVDTLKLLHSYPNTKLDFSAKKKLLEIADKRFKKQKPALTEIMKTPEGKGERADRIANLLRALVALQDKEFTVPVLAELASFMRRYPAHPSVGEMEFLQGKVHAVNGNNLAAILIYEKIITLSKNASLGARAQSAIGDIYAAAFKNYDKAIEAYRMTSDKFPQEAEAGLAYAKSARIIDEQLKQPGLALEILQKVVSLYPGTDAAYQSLLDQARILKDKLADPGSAVQRLEMIADGFKGDRAADALAQAAVVAGVGLKNVALQVRLLERLAGEYPDNKASPQALWDAGQLYERPLSDPSAARKAYQTLAAKYPGNLLSPKAAKRIKALEK